MDVSAVSATQRLALGVGFVLLGSMLGQPNLGLEPRISALATIFGIGFLGAAFEPPLTGALDANEWDELSGLNQTMALFFLGIGAIVMLVVVTAAQRFLWGLF